MARQGDHPAGPSGPSGPSPDGSGDAADLVRQTRDGLAGLDPVLQHRARLGACVLLSGVEAFSFSRLRELLDETDGNLGAQLRKLEDAGYVAVRKEFVDRRPVSWYGLTPAGGRALRAHLAALEALIGAAGGNGPRAGQHARVRREPG